MSINFPSIGFFDALMEQTAEGSDALEDVGDDDILFAADVEGNMFMVEFADRACVAVALGGNPNDMEFVLAGAIESWIKLLSATEDAEEFASLLHRDGIVSVACADDACYERFSELLPTLRKFFGGARSFNWAAS
jgi:hypothetical protein